METFRKDYTMKKRLIIPAFALVLILFILPISFADIEEIDPSKPWFPLHFLASCTDSECYLADSLGTGNIDYARGLTGSDISPLEEISVDLRFWHPISQIAKSNTDFTSIDANNNGWPDVCDRLLPDDGELPQEYIDDYAEKAGAMYEPMYAISMGLNILYRIDSEDAGWPDKCDCVLSELHHDKFNCGECGNACAVGTTPACCDSECKDLDNDNDNCGSCGNSCGINAYCLDGACKCNANYADCNGAGDGSDADGCECYTGGSNVCYNNACCTPSSWSPATSTICSGQTFTQTSNCGTTRTATGTRVCCTWGWSGWLNNYEPRSPYHDTYLNSKEDCFIYCQNKYGSNLKVASFRPGRCKCATHTSLRKDSDYKYKIWQCT